MCNDEKTNLFTGLLSVSQCLFSAFWRAENTIYAHSSTGLAHFVVITKEQKNIMNQEKCVEQLVRLAGHKIPGIVNSYCWSSNTRIPHLMSCIIMSNDESVIYVLFS